MKRRRQLAISLSAAVLSGMLVYGVYVLQLRQVNLQETVAVLVPRRFIPAGTMLMADHLETRLLPRGAVTDEMVTDPAEAVGLETSAPLGAGEPLLRWKLDRYRLLPAAGEATFQIPREYVKSISNGIRAGDSVRIYLSETSTASRRLFPEPIRVAGVKTSANQELDSPKNPNLLSMASGNEAGMYASRRDANGTIDVINLNLSEAQWLAIDAACKSGEAKLVIAFDAAAFSERTEEAARP